MSHKWTNVNVRGYELVPGDMFLDGGDIMSNEWYGALVVSKHNEGRPVLVLLDYDGTLMEDVKIWWSTTCCVHRKVER